MPQIYRRHSEYVQRPPSEPRRRSSLAPQLTDADDSIVLSDLVRTGEASRLRRRGAMRLEHGAPRPLLTGAATFTGAPPLPLNPTRFAPQPRPLVVPPSRPSSPPWGPSTMGALLGADDADSSSYSNETWRLGDWSTNEPLSEPFPIQTEADQGGRPWYDESDQEYVLVCGGENSLHAERQYVQPFHSSILPVPRAKPSSSSTSTSHRRTNGCGTVIHMRAIPQRRRGVWQGAAHAAPADVVVSLDASYFDRSVVAKMLRSACGCIREGVGCAVCGNPLGTRYLPCPAASEGLFSPASTSAPRPRPRHPSGPSYWDPRVASMSPSRSRAGGKFFVYTFFADHVSSQPSFDFDLAPHSARREPRREQEQMPELMSPTLSVDQQTEAGDTWYGFRPTASPRPFSYSESMTATEILDSPGLSTVPLPLTAVDDTDSGALYDRLGGLLDADGELLDPEAILEDRDDLAMLNSADNDKSRSEPVMLPGR